MYEHLLEYFIGEPRRLIGLGRGLVRSGGFILLVGAIGSVGTTAIDVVQGFGKHAAMEPTLATLYPSLPTWWIPESIIGCLPAILIMTAGITVAELGKKLKRAYF